MTQKQIDTLLQQAVEKWGEDSQLGMMQEECAELIQAISKYERNGAYQDYENICEEIADVELMIAQMKYIFGDKADELISKMKEKKLLRLKDRLAPVTIIHKHKGS